ncbi:nucleoid-associated protein [Nakamurella panacisegetis]|nr:nucleoid-associated protein [Nakamurella panacisegetis]
MHQIPNGRRTEDDADPIEYSEAPIELDAADRAFIQQRLRATLGGRARPVIEDVGLASPSPALIKGLATLTGNLVKDSAQLASMLFAQQKAVSPGGLVMTVIGAVDTGPCVAIAKMEHQEGMRVQPVNTATGLRTYKAEHLRDLILSEGTRVFKVGVFPASSANAGSLLGGVVVDDQQVHGGVAQYFIEFLGCKFVQRADVLTETFLKATQKFIRVVTKDDPEANAEYEIAVIAELQGNSDRVMPTSFAANHLRPEHQDEYMAAIEAAGLPAQSFEKDTTLISSQIRRIRISTARGADALVPPDMYQDGSVQVSETETGGQSTITITDRITKMSGAGGKVKAD